MSNYPPTGFTQQWVPLQNGLPQGPAYWQQQAPPPSMPVPGYGGGYVPPRKNRNTVNQVKALLAQAAPGQLLDIAKHASAELRAKNPTLHQELVKAVVGGASAPVAQAKGTLGMDTSEITSRKAVWKGKCETDPLVAYRDSVILQVQKQHGTKVAVDDMVCDMPNIDLKRYMQGKKRREALLSECGLARDGVNFVLLPDWVDTSCQDSLSGDCEDKDEESEFVTKQDFLAMQVSLFAKFEELMGKSQTPNPGTLRPPGAPPVRESGPLVKGEAKEQGVDDARK